MAKLAPSILSANFDILEEQIEQIEQGGADIVHLDIMDGIFVPNTTFGPEVVKRLLGKTKLPFDVHFMVTNPKEQIKDFISDQTEYISFHEEATNNPKEIIDYIHSFNVKAGLAISPETSVDRVKPFLKDLEFVLVMTVHPGKGGQKFISSTALKVAELDEYRRVNAMNYKIEVDGGINLENCQSVKKLGADIFVAGSSCFGAEDITARCQEFKKLLK